MLSAYFIIPSPFLNNAITDFVGHLEEAETSCAPVSQFLEPFQWRQLPAVAENNPTRTVRVNQKSKVIKLRKAAELQNQVIILWSL